MTRRWTTLLMAGLLTAGWVPPAGAQPPAQAPIEETATKPVTKPAPPVRTKWYGWQLLLGDAASLAAGLAVGARNPDAGFLTFAGGYLLASPIIHLSHRRPGKGALSLLLRAGLPSLGVGLVLWSDSKTDSLAAILVTGLLGLTGAATAAVVDWSVLGTTVSPVKPTSTPVLVPQVSAGGDGSFQIGVQGRF